MAAKTVVIMQPGYLPWLGFFELLWQSDIFVIYDEVQYDKNGWRNRNRIKTANGPIWLTVPVTLPNGLETKIKEARIVNDQPWQKKHASAIEQNYRKAPCFRYFGTYLPEILKIYEQKWEKLLDLDLALIKIQMEMLGLKREMILSSELSIPKEEEKVGRLIKIVKELGGDRFYEPAGGKNYLDEPEIARFRDAGIEFEFQNYQHPVYRQLYGEFVPCLSAIDLLLNEGPESLKILTSTSTKGGKQ